MSLYRKLVFALLALVVALGGLGLASHPAAAATNAPSIRVVEVVEDKDVTIRGSGFPANGMFEVLMNKEKSKGEDGIKVGIVRTGSSGSFEATFRIPPTMQDRPKVDIRVQAGPTSATFAYATFENYTWERDGGRSDDDDDDKPGSGSGSGSTANKPYSGFPSFTIVGVEKEGNTVRVQFKNLPPKTNFSVLMGKSGSRGEGGIRVGSFSTGGGGDRRVAFTVPSSLRDQYRVALRLQSEPSRWVYYSWFYYNR